MRTPVNTHEQSRILIVDDDLFIRTIFQATLEKAGSHASLKLAPYDLVLLDLNMPGKDGFATCQELRTRSPMRHKPYGLTAFF